MTAPPEFHQPSASPFSVTAAQSMSNSLRTSAATAAFTLLLLPTPRRVPPQPHGRSQRPSNGVSHEREMSALSMQASAEASLRPQMLMNFRWRAYGSPSAL